MTAPIPHLVCGCTSTHYDECDLGLAEAAALNGAAEPREGHPIIKALQGMESADVLREGDVDENVITGILDILFMAGCIGRRS